MLKEFNEAVSSEMFYGLVAEFKLSYGGLFTVGAKADILSQRLYTDDSYVGNKITQGVSAELGVGPMTPLKAEVGREAGNAELGHYILNPEYRERVSESTTGFTYDPDTISFSYGEGYGGKVNISRKETEDFLNKLGGTLLRMFRGRSDD